MAPLGRTVVGLTIVAAGIVAAGPFKRSTPREATPQPAPRPAVVWRKTDTLLELPALAAKSLSIPGPRRDSHLEATPAETPGIHRKQPEIRSETVDAPSARSMASQFEPIEDPPSIAASQVPVEAQLPIDTAALQGVAYERRHAVADGDQLTSLAHHYFGDADRWPEIYLANRGVLDDPLLLPLGVELRIPIGTHSQDPAKPPRATVQLRPAN